jgi:hypothetical protein
MPAHAPSRWPLAWALLAGVVALGCGGGGDEEPPPEIPSGAIPGGEAETGAEDAGLRDQLEALGYIEATPEPVDPARTNVVVYDPERAQPGYNLYCTFVVARADLIDLEGNVIHSWADPQSREWVGCKLMPNGDLILIGVDLDPAQPRRTVDSQRYLARYSWDGELLWKRRLYAHHHVAPAPAGRMLTLTFEYRALDDVSREAPVRDDHVAMIDGEGQVVEERSLYDALNSSPDRFTFVPFPAMLKWGRKHVDLIHANTVEWIDAPDLAVRSPFYGPDHIIVTSRHQDLVAVIDWKANELVWAWGPGQIIRPHDAIVLESGHILVFDNGDEKRPWSRVLELDPSTEEVVWEYRAPNPTDFFTMARGANQRLPNGNTLITNSNSGHAFEVTREGEIVWEFLTPYLTSEGRRPAIQRVRRYSLDYVDAIVRAHAARPGP